MHPVVLILLLDLILVAPLSAWLADQKGRSPSGWFVAAAIAGPIALLVLGFAPTSWAVEEARRRTRRCERCDAPVSRVARQCWTCAAELPAMPEPEPEVEPEPEPAPAPALPPEPVPVIRTVVKRRSSGQLSGAAAVDLPTTRPIELAVAAAAPRVSARRAAAPAPEGRRSTVEPERGSKVRAVAASAPVATVPGRATPTEPTRSQEDETAARDAAEELDDGKLDDGKVEDLSRRRGVENLATGVFAGGVSELGAGYRYLISVSPRMLYVSGPVDVAPQHVVFRAPRTEIDATMFGGDLVVVAESPNGRKRQLIFRGIAGTGAAHIVAVLNRENQPVSRRRTRGSGRSTG